MLEAPDAQALADFYAALLDWQVRSSEPGWVTIAPEGAAPGGAYLAFNSSAEYVPPVWPPVAGEQQMMLHLDLEVDDLPGAVEDAVALGARVAEHQPQDDVRVMLDPVGHPFCLWIRTGES